MSDLAVLNRRLLDGIDALGRFLGIDGRRVGIGNKWEGRASGGRIEIKLRGHNAGSWGAWSQGAASRSLIGLIAWRRGVEFAEAIGLAREFLGEATHADNEDDDDQPPAAYAGRGIARARAIAGRLRSIHGTAAENYLTQTRGIPLPSGGWPAAIGFDPVDRAVGAVVADDDGQAVAVHRVFLTPDGYKIDAAEVEARHLAAVKQTNGPKSLGRLFLGETGIGPLLVCEGLETRLAVHVATGRDVLVLLGPLSHLHALPPGRELILCREDDAPGSPAFKTTATRISRWADEGHDLAVAWPWPERRGDRTDLADTVLALGPEAVAAQIAAAEPVRARPSPLRTNLPAYYPGPTEPREAALARQDEIIESTIAGGVRLAVLRDQVRVRRSELLGGNLDPTPAEKAAATRQASQEIAGGPLAKPGRMLLTGNQGGGKTRCMIAAVAAIRDDPVTVCIAEPTLTKCEEVAADYRKAAGPDSLPVIVVRGRGAIDPGREATTMCERPAAAAAIAAAGIAIRATLCPTCPAAGRCGYLRQQRDIDALAGRGAVFIMATPYLYLPSPAPVADVLIVDEDAVMQAVAVVTLPLADLDPYMIGGVGNDVQDTLYSIRAAMRAARPLETLRAANIDRAEIKRVHAALMSRLDAFAPRFDGLTDDATIIDALDQPERRRIHAVLAMLSAIRLELDAPRPTLNAITIQRETVTVSYLRKLHGARNATILALDGTGDPGLARHVYGERLVHHRIAIERRAHVIGTSGKGYSRQSITGLDRNGDPRSDKLVAEAAQLRVDIGSVARQLPGTPFIVSNKAAITALNLPADAPQAHFGALRGLNTWERCRSAVIVGRESVPVGHLESLSRAFLARDPTPFLPAGGYVKATRMRRMRDGAVSPVTVEVHPDPRIQRVLEQIREAELVQAIDRLRPVWHRREYALLNNLVLDVTYDVIRSHAEAVAGGHPLERTYLATGILPLGGRDLHLVNPGLFRTDVAASRALAKYPLPPNKEPLWSGKVFCYRRHGQRGRASRALIDLSRHHDPRAALAKHLGPIDAFQESGTVPQPLARAPSVARPPATTSPNIADGAWIASKPHARPPTHAPPVHRTTQNMPSCACSAMIFGSPQENCAVK